MKRVTLPWLPSQELKGNIRVFCRVRPALSASDVALQSAEARGIKGGKSWKTMGKTIGKKHEKKHYKWLFDWENHRTKWGMFHWHV